MSHVDSLMIQNQIVVVIFNSQVPLPVDGVDPIENDFEIDIGEQCL